MNDDLESQLRAALRPVAPPSDLRDRILAGLPAPRPQARRRGLWWGSGVAASLLLALGIYSHVQNVRETAAGMEARREVLQALRVTHQKLDLAYQSVKDRAEGTS
jgi:hypothetical protein